jgi:hypothetical protein
MYTALMRYTHSWALVPKPSCFEGDTAIKKVEKYKSPGTDTILAELIQAGGNMSYFEIHKFITSISNRAELPQQQKESIIVLIYKKGDKLTVVIMEEYHCYQLHT